MADQPVSKGSADSRLSAQAHVVQMLATYRKEWQATAQRQSLLDVEAPVGLILSEIANMLGLNPQERHAMLGGKLINQVDTYLDQPVHVRLPS
jgi:hypothetical protein